MGGTRPESTTEATNGITSLADAIEHVDEPQDSRSCPHNCHGSLDVDDDDRVYCTSCHCTPDGVFLPPTSYSNHSNGKRDVGHSDSVEVYYNSRNVILAGGYEAPYDECESERPHGVGDEYTFDLTP